MRANSDKALPADTPRGLRILSFLSGDDPRLVKRAVQELCTLAEANPRFVLGNEVRVRLARHLWSQDVQVRRWLSKLIGLLRDESYVSWVRRQLTGAEDVPENITWATAAIGALYPHDDPKLLLQRFDLPWSGSPESLAVRYFRPEPNAVPRELAVQSIDSGDPLAAQWLALLHSQRRGHVDRDVITALTAHPDPAVSEYAIWSLVQEPTGRFAHSELGPDEVADAAAQVKRWSLRLLGKSPHDLHSHSELVLALAQDSEPAVREGAALALGAWRLTGSLAVEVAGWYVREEDQLVRDALVQHLDTDVDRVVYREALEARPPSLELLVATTDLESGATIFVSSAIKRTLSGVPAISKFETCETYLLAVDTVGFSKLPDSHQVAVLGQLLAVCAGDDEVKAVDPDNAVYLITGDGLIAAFRGADTGLLPLRLGARMRDQIKALHGYEVRLGVNSGRPQWLQMDDGSRQILGDGINWTVRVMSVADNGELLVSNRYYDHVAKPKIDYLTGFTFSDEINQKTKHDEPLVVRRVS